jgi:DNA modification methylase
VLFFGEKWKRSRSSDLFDFPIGEQGGVANHPCPKPLKMWLDLLDNYSDPGAIIYEPFGGSGTTMLACQNLGRRCRMCEISPAYSAVVLQRMTDAYPDLVIELVEDGAPE